VSDRSARDLLQALSGFPLSGIIHTDIARDGMLEGPDLSSLRDVLEWSSFPVIASGGVSRVEDLQAIKALGPRIVGVIVGKALYEGKLALAAASAAASAG
jgi:phosphoribosylformimino-5-aminoimidazole carboxamide ribotide isomerase